VTEEIQNPTLLDVVLDGLLSEPKSLPSMYLYDAEGSRLFEEICALPEYYVSRTETALLAGAAAEIADLIADGSVLVEFGSGSSSKTRLLFDAAPGLSAYVPIDISREALADAAGRIRADYPEVAVHEVAGDFMTIKSLPKAVRALSAVGLLAGSAIGNYTPVEACELLANARRLLGSGSKLIVGADLAQSPEVLIPAYNDARGVTAAFNKNLLTRLNRDLNADFDLEGFEHRSVWNAEENRIEMHLVSTREISVSIAGQFLVHFGAGETIHTENSYKHPPKVFEEIVASGGWRLEKRWLSAQPQFGIFLLH
jgi:dimethylhistidine N-methyltransferase